MIGFVIVSHSKKLAEEVINLCNEMKKYDFPVINGSGTDGDYLGSNPNVIKKAIESAYSEDGVIIIGDIGSSILNSERAIKFLDDSFDRQKIKIADAPLVEGTLAAMAINNGSISINDILTELLEFKNFSKI